MAHKKAGGSTQLGRDSIAKRLGVKLYGGQAVRAGHVARVHDSGGPGYSYMLVLHGDNISTVYGHMSGFAVQEGEDVEQGQIIGYTGGAPGARGSGLSSGPHLHFEVRQDDVPLNPRNFLSDI